MRGRTSKPKREKANAFMNPMYGSGYVPQGPRFVNFGWISEAWGYFLSAAGIWIVGVLAYTILNMSLISLMKSLFPNPHYVQPPNPFGWQLNFGVTYGVNSDLTPLGQVLSLLLSWALSAFQGASLCHLAVKQVRGEPIAWSDIASGRPYWGSMMIYNLLAILAIIAGVFVMCIGVWVAAGFLLPGQAMVADGKRPLDAIAESVDAMKRDWVNAAGFAFVFSMILFISMLPCLTGLLVTIPMVYIISALAYRDMVGMTGLRSPVVAPDNFEQQGHGVWPPPPNLG